MVRVIPFPDKKYSVLYADPPWTYKDKAESGKRGVAFKYELMTIDEIQALPVHEIVDEDCVLFLWVTWPLLEEGLETMRAWGFKYKTVGFVWIKLLKRMDKLFATTLKTLQKITEGTLAARVLKAMLETMVFWGMGNWTRSNSEVCLIGIKGKPKRVDAGVHSVVLAPICEHSRKPDEVRARIERLMGDVPRIELFARTRIPGWDSWGNEVQT
ncbi:MT-A70 family methyltransferase [Alicyclobacillus dauci]|uniref:MT-A70 family methyltransferase n=1 Tax=Alicyclobacillus dauci TaxID=1475485 RepID=A0ABY6Z763_9BACL|nr:MT-A70 family methyltransferase [Alicyclobacillus dauci]WAH38590.1 MT-A70 family methyltransferase [Alicyclobacillus dauci]